MQTSAPTATALPPRPVMGSENWGSGFKLGQITSENEQMSSQEHTSKLTYLHFGKRVVSGNQFLKCYLRHSLVACMKVPRMNTRINLTTNTIYWKILEEVVGVLYLIENDEMFVNC